MTSRPYIVIRRLRVPPCRVIRQPGCFLLAVDPDATKIQTVAWCVEHLTVEENDVLRAAYGQGPTGTPLTSALCTDEPVTRFIPPALRTPAYNYPERRQDEVGRALWLILREEQTA